jgi:hypothetical protein
MGNCKHIPNTNDRYIIYEDGRVYDSINKRYLTIGYASKRKYKSVRISYTNKKATTYVHRLLAEAFIPNPNNKPQVNHKDCNCLNNSLDNLEWVTIKENLHHAWDNGLCKSWNAGTGKRHDPKLKEKVLELKALGFSHREVAKTLKMDKSYVSIIINNKEIKKRSRRTA